MQIIPLRKDEHTERIAKSSAQIDLWVQGMTNQTGVKNAVLPQKSKQALCRPRVSQREGTQQTGTGVRFNRAARCLEVLWKYTIFTQTINQQKRECIWVYAREIAHAKNNV